MAVRKAEVLYIGDAASIVRAAKEAEAAQARLAAAAKAAGGEIAAANKVAGDSSMASATKQEAAHKRASAAIASTGSALTKLTAPILLAAGAGVKFAVDFQSQMEQVHTQAGASQAEVAKMSKAVLAMAPAAEQGPKQLASALYLIESVGLRGATALKTLSAASKGSAIGAADLTDTTDALAGTMVALHEKGDMAAKTMASIDAVVGVGKMHMQDFVDSLKSGIVPTATAVGLSFNSMAAGLATMTDAGVPAEMAATKMRTILLMLANEHTKAAIANLQSIGLTSDNLATAMRKPGNGLLDVLQLLQDHLNGLSKVKQVDIVSSLAGGSRSAGTLITLLQNMDRVGNKYGQITQLSTQFNQRVAAESETAGHKIKTAWSAVQATLIQVGGAVAPVVKTLAGDVSQVAQWFTALPPGLQHAIVTGGLIVAGIGPARKLVSLFGNSVTGLVSVAKAAARLAITPLGKGFFGGGSAAAAGRLGSTVATMEVGTLVARSMVGGGAGVSGVAAKAEGGVAVAEGEVATAATASRLTLAKLVPVIGGVALGAKGLYDAFNGSGGGLEGGIERFLKGTIGMILPGGAFPGPHPGSPLNQALDFVRSNGVGGNSSSPDINALAAYINKFDQLKGDVSSLTPKALVELKAEGEKLARDPSLAKYRGTVLAVMQSLAGVADSAEGQGRKIAQGLQKGWNTSRFQSEPLMLQQLQSKIKGLPPQMQAGAIQSVISYAKGLQSQGRLPAGAWQSMLAQVNSLFPGWEKSLGASAAMSAETFTKGLDLTKAEANTRATLNAISHDFPQVSAAMDKTKGDVIDKAAASVRALRSIDVSGSAPMLAAVTRDTHKLRQVVSADLSKMVAVSASSANDMRHSIETGSIFAAQAAESNFGRVASAVGRAMNSGLLSAGTGAKLIGQDLNAMLQAFGAKAIPIVGTVTQQLDWKKWFMSGSTGSASGPGHMAQGGVVQFGRAGDRGPDSIPVNFGGMPIKVGSGEMGAVLNGEQQAELNARTADVGGLRGFFSKFRRPHNMASGGIVTASQFGGPGDPGTGSVGYRGDNLYAHPDSYAELNMGTALGGLPYMAPLNVSYHGHTARLFKRDIGAGGPGLNGHTRAIDLWFQAAQALGLSGLADVLVNGGAGVNVSIAGGGGLSQIPVPKVRGTGTVARIIRALLGKETSAANRYASSHMPSVNMGVTGMMGGSPVGHGAYAALSLGRTDQGVDFGGAGPVEAVLPGRVLRNTEWGGWPGTGGIVYSTPRGNVYVMEDFAAAMRVGQTVRQGQVIGQATGGSSGIETGWANSAGTGPATPYNGAPDGTPMPGGIAFRKFLGFVRGGMFSPTPRAAGGPMTAGGVYRVGENGPETLYMNQGGVVRNPGASLAGTTLTPAQLISFGLTKNLIFPIAAVLSALQKLVSNGLSDHTNAIAKLRSTITTLNGQIVQARLAGNSSMVLALQTERTAIEKRIKSLEQTSAREVNKRIADLTQLQAFRDAITQLRNTANGLAGQAAAAWASSQTRGINAAHTAAIRAIGNSPAAKLLRKLQAQDVAEQNKQQLDSLNQAVKDAQNLAAHSGGQTHLDALKQLKAAQQALADYQRQQEEARLQAGLATATKVADKTQQTKLNELHKEEADYKKTLQAKFAALLESLKKGKISYATWAADVDKILGKYHLHIPTDAATEITVTAGPGSLGPHHRHHLVHHGGHVGHKTTGSDAMRHPHETRLRPAVNIEKAYFTGTRAARAFADRLAHRAAIGTA